MPLATPSAPESFLGWRAPSHRSQRVPPALVEPLTYSHRHRSGLCDRLGDLRVRIQNIRAAAQAHGRADQRLHPRQTTAQTELCEKAFEIASAMLSCANTVKNNELARKVTFTKTDLNRSRDTQAAGLCQNIRTEATANLAALATYAVTAADLTDSRKNRRLRSRLAKPPTRA